MSGVIAEAAVRIRPDMRGFRSETEAGVRSTFREVARIAGGIFATAGALEAAKAVVSAAATQEEELAVVRNAVSATNAAWVVHGKTVETTLRDMAVRFGFTVSDLAQGFTRIQVGTKDSAKTFDLLDLAMDVSRARHLGLAQAAVILTRAAQGNDVSLRRLGIIIPKVTTNIDALKRSHDEAIASGAKFSKQDEILYKGALARAAALDKEATKTKIVAEIQSRFGGQSVTFSRTAQGAFQSFREAVNELEVSLGRALIPTLTVAAEGAARFFKDLADSEGVGHAVAGTAHEIGDALHGVKVVLDEIGPPLGATLGLVGRTLGAIGGAPLLAAVATLKGIHLAVGLASFGLRELDKVVAAGAASAAAEASANENVSRSLLGRAAAALRSSSASKTSATATDVEAASTSALTAALAENTAALAANAAGRAGGKAAAVPTTVAPAASAVAVATTVEARLSAAALTAELGVLVPAINATTVSTLRSAAGSEASAAAKAEEVAATDALAASQAAVVGTTEAESAALAAEVAALRATINETLASAAASAKRTATLAADTVATEANTVAVGENASALALRVGAYLRTGRAASSAAAATAADTAAIEAQNVAAATGASRLALFGRGLVALATSPTGIIVGLAGVAAGITYLLTRESALSKANHELAGSLRDLKRAADEVPTDRLSLDQANLAVETARAEVQASKAARTSTEYRQLVLNLREAEDQRRKALDALADAQERQASGLADQLSALRKISDASRVLRQPAGAVGARYKLPEVENSVAGARRFADAIQSAVESSKDLTPLMAHNLGLLQQFALQQRRRPSEPEIRIIVTNRDAKASLDEVETRLNRLLSIDREVGRLAGIATWAQTVTAAKSAASAAGAEAALLGGKSAAASAAIGASAESLARWIQRVRATSSGLPPLLRHNVDLLVRYARRLGEIPNPVETRVILNNKDAEASLAELLAAIRASVNDFGRAGTAAGSAYVTGLESSFGNISNVFNRAALEASAAAGRLSGTVPGAVGAVQAAADAAVRRAGEDRQKIIEGVYAAHQETIDQLAQGVEDAVASGAQAVHDAVVQAQLNLTSLGGTIAGMIGQIIDAGPLGETIAALSAGGSAIDAELRRIGDTTRSLYVLPGTIPGLLDPGNLDLLHRKIAKVGDDIATVRSITVGIGKDKFVLLPTIVDGKALVGSFEEVARKAIDVYKRTGKNLGEFASEATADAYAERLHLQQAKFYGAGRAVGDGFTSGLRKALEDSQLLSELQAGTDPLGKQIARLTGTLNARQARDQRKGLVDAVAQARREFEGKEAALPKGPFNARQKTDIAKFLAPAKEALRRANQGLADFDDQATIARLATRHQHETDALAKRTTAERDALTRRAQNEKDFVTRRIADLTASVNLGKIGPEALQTQINALIAREGGFKGAGKRLGLAFRVAFENSVSGLLAQAREVATSPGGPRGQGLGPTIVRPLDAIHDAQKQIERARAAQHKETNRVLKEINGKLAASRFTKGLPRATGARQNAADAADLAGVTP